MLDQSLRQAKEALFHPLMRGPLKRISPDIVTRWAFLVGLACALAAGLGQPGWALVLWWVNRFLDGLDGSLARAQQTQSDWGGYQDIVLDHVVYAAIPLGIAVSSGEGSVTLACALLQAAYFVNTISWCYLAALLEKRQQGAQTRGEMTSITMPPALIEGTETVLFFTAFLIWPDWAAPLFVLKALLVGVGVGQRWLFAAGCLKP